MTDQKLPENVELRFTEHSDEGAPPQRRQHGEVGWSSLYGRVGDNMTYHCYRGDSTWQRMWSWIWKDLWEVFIGLFRLFSFRSK